ncbi:MAG: hypothetical protein COT15_02435 [Candidatus Diapherotrites archaeon CG08_land_8_20_14_0_20_34_12]|nr:MAG: hypothetical protein COT15_02435 [Candidatus Diapherotrites archaeon CG08_land_8_20_14_0_20_34_12]
MGKIKLKLKIIKQRFLINFLIFMAVRRPISRKGEHLGSMRFLNTVARRLARAASKRGIPKQTTAELRTALKVRKSAVMQLSNLASDAERADAEIRWQRLYSQTPWSRSSRRTHDAIYSRTPKRKRSQRTYNLSEKGKKRMRQYRVGPKGVEVSTRASKKYLQTDKGRQKVRKDIARAALKDVLARKRSPTLTNLKCVLRATFSDKVVADILNKSKLRDSNKPELFEIMQAISGSRMLYRKQFNLGLAELRQSLFASIRAASNDAVERTLALIHNALPREA